MTVDRLTSCCRCLNAVLMIALTVLATPGCRPTVHDLDEGNLSVPEAMQAASRARAGDREGAIAQYNQLLNEQPSLARVHLDLAFLYDDPEGDYVRALYHYQRYLEMRPGTEKQTLIGERIDNARRTLAAAYGYGAEPLQARIAELESENLALRETLHREEARVPEDRTTEIPPGPQVVGAPAERTAADAPLVPAAADVRYVVRDGDSLSSLAQRFYNDARQWYRIYDNNRDRIANPNVLPSGVTIVIPALPSGNSR